MFNIRRVDKKFYISGGWENIERDAEWLKTENIRAVLDLQYTIDDNTNVPNFVKTYLVDEGIEYEYIQMYDASYNRDIAGLYERGQSILEAWDNKFTNKKDRILIKCAGGVSRSVSHYLNYICKRDNISYIEARENLWQRERELMGYSDGTFFWMGEPNLAFEVFLSAKYPSPYRASDYYELVFKGYDNERS